ncbi:MAG: hypothetical protein SW833_10410 [Cyanobacteriota bacterium]|nr:hypothetical protein [Cyanobacteriota bacterium]
MEIEGIKLEDWAVCEHHLELAYCADEFRFSTKIFYHDVSFSSLKSKYSQKSIEKIAAHIALFEGMKLCSLFPKYYDISNLSKYLSEASLDLFVKVYQGVFGQHWYENNRTDYQQPEFIYGQNLGESHPLTLLEKNLTILTGCGGGKDSIVAMKILQEAEIPFASMQYSHSVYGRPDLQHNLIEGVLDCVKPVKKHRISVCDDFTDDPWLQLYFPNISGITIPETPVSIFEALFLMLQWDYQYLNLAHEKSANTGNLFWSKLGKEVNHQWGKSLEAERLMNDFVQKHLLSGFKYFSILQPIYDFRIFKKISEQQDVLPKIHSCNIQKPWCKKCPKCAYVWLGLMANCDRDRVDAVFQSNLFDDEELLPIFRQMVGLDEHTPFECIGEIDESRLAMKKCWEKGLSGRALKMFNQEILSDRLIDWQHLENKYNRIYETEHAIPHWVFQRVQELL